MRVIGIAGRIGSGKDYLARHLKSVYFSDAVIISFADQLKLSCILDENPKNQQETQEIYNNYFDLKPQEIRQKIQEFGCSLREDNEHIWVNMLYTQLLIYTSRGIDTIIISDVRFPNEASFIKSIGGMLIKVVAPSRNSLATQHLTEESKNHLSESFVESMDCDVIINNEVGEDFEGAVTAVIDQKGLCS